MKTETIIAEMEQHRATVHFHEAGAFVGKLIQHTLHAELSDKLDNLAVEPGAFHFKTWPLADLVQAKEVFYAVKLTLTAEDERLFESGEAVFVRTYCVEKQYS